MGVGKLGGRRNIKKYDIIIYNFIHLCGDVRCSILEQDVGVAVNVNISSLHSEQRDQLVQKMVHLKFVAHL